MGNKRINKAYVRYDGSGRVIPGSLILNRFKPAVGNWQETPAYLCCNPNPLPSNCMEMDITTQVGIDPETNDVTIQFRVFESTSTTITIDWGDGTQSSAVIDSENSFDEAHEYPERGVTYTIRVCFGNIDNISTVISRTGGVYNEETGISTYSLTEIRGIKNFTSLIDIDIQNQRFASFDVSGMNLLEEIELGDNALLSYVNFGAGLPNLDELFLERSNFSGSFNASIFTNLQRLNLESNDFTNINSSNLLNLQFLIVYDNPNLSNLDITGSPSILFLIGNNCAIPIAQIDSILVQLDANGVTNGTVNLSGGTNGIPTATGLAAKASLEGKGWTVNVNS